jgi:methylmalonyl-CoA mutase N-terminal domain/subunit
VDGALDELRRVASAPAGRPGPEHNVLYPMRRALAAHATVGEVCHALREVWGAYVPNDAF